MFTIALLTALTLASFPSRAIANPIAQQITPNFNVPAGYQVGFATVSPSFLPSLPPSSYLFSHFPFPHATSIPTTTRSAFTTPPRD